MRLFSDPRLARLIAKALWRDGRSIHECPKDSPHLPMLGRYYLMQRREVVRKHVDVEQLARELGLLEIPPPPPRPQPGAMVGIHDLIGRRASRWQPAVPGLVKLDAAALWHAIERRGFPPPIRTPAGLRWSLEAVSRWQQSNHL